MNKKQTIRTLGSIESKQTKQPKQTVEVPKVDYSHMNLPPKPEGIEIDCFGCSS